MLNQMIDSGSLTGRGLVGFWRAQSDGDDVRVYEGDAAVHPDTEPIATFHGLRQQVSLIDRCGTFHLVVSIVHQRATDPPLSTSLLLLHVTFTTEAEMRGDTLPK